MRGLAKGKPTLDVASFPLVRGKLAQKAGSLSGGEKRIIALLLSLLSEPSLLLIDEFSEGLQPSVVPELLGFIRQSCSRGMMCIIVAHSDAMAREEASLRLVAGRGKLIPQA